jgi:hypothetical protein
LSSKYIGILQAIYSNARAKIRTQFGFSKGFKIERGVLQGETLSGKLFTIFLDDLIRKLEESGVPALQLSKEEIHALLYADDICLLASNSIHLQEKIEILRTFFESNGLKVNLSKTNVVIFRKRGNLKCIPCFFWGESSIEVVEEYKYLGVPFHAKIMSGDKKTAQYFLQKAKLAENGLHQLFFRSKVRTLRSRLTLFNSLVQSVLLYCSPVWALTEHELLTSFQSNFLKRVLNLPKYTPRWFVRLETNATPIKFYFFKAAIKFLIRLRLQNPDTLSNSALNELILLHKNPKSDNSINWFSKLVCLCKEFQVDHIMDMENILEKPVTEIYDNLNHALSSIISKDDEADIAFMRNSKEFKNISEYKTHIKCEEYLNVDVPWCMLTLLCQLKLNYNYISVKNMCSSLAAKRYTKESEIACRLCGAPEEDSAHIMCECPHYASARNFLFSKIKLKYRDRINFTKNFSNYDKEFIKSIYIFWCESMKIRQVYLNEID